MDGKEALVSVEGVCGSSPNPASRLLASPSWSRSSKSCNLAKARWPLVVRAVRTKVFSIEDCEGRPSSLPPKSKFSMEAISKD